MGTHLRVWLGILLLAIVTTPLLSGEERLRAAAITELGMIKLALGTKATETLIRNTNTIYSSLFVENGTLEGLRSKTSTEDERRHAGQMLGSPFYHFTSAANGYLLSFITLLYLSLLRFLMLFQWLPFLTVFVGAAFLDGGVQHKIAQASVKVSNPVKAKLAQHALIIGIGMPLAYLFAPFAVTPYFILGWAVVIVFPLMTALAEMAPFTYR